MISFDQLTDFTIEVSHSKMKTSKLQPAIRIQECEPSVWVEFGNLVEQHKAVPLSRGSPDFLPPTKLLDALEKAVVSENVLLNQYTRSYGHLRLVNVISQLYGKLTGHDIDPISDLLVTIGAYEALYCSILGNINPGDEVIIIEPFYDCYVPMVKMAGGVPVFVPLKLVNGSSSTGEVLSESWVLDRDELASKFNAKTKALILNSPHNPTGKVFSKEELEYISELTQKWDALVICDQVYEFLVYDGKPFTRICSLPGMWERTISIASAGKIFSATGWKIGWAYGPKNLIFNLQAVHQNCVYTSPTPIQEAIAIALEDEVKSFGSAESYLIQLRSELESKRNQLLKVCTDIGLTPVIPAGTYFMIVDYENLAKKFNYDDGSSSSNDYKMCRWLIKEKKLAALPVTCFYSEQHRHLGEKYFRLAFVKNDETLGAAEAILAKLKK
ncbi:hypothetical protein CHUAL_006139 [Chamberlinius hualienensis]